MLSLWTMLFIPGAVLLASVGYFVHLWIVAPYDHFAKRGVSFRKPRPVFGTMGGLVFKQESFFDMIVNTYNQFKGERYYGIFDFSKPQLSIRDPELIKKVTVKDFEHFIDHRPFLKDMEDEALFGKSLLLLTGQRWRDMRHTLSPAFTGRKMRQMFQLVVECSDQATRIISKETKESTAEPKVWDMKDLCNRFASDIIATSVFGLKVNSLDDRDNEFYKKGLESTSMMGFKVLLKFLILMSFPKVAKFFQIRLFGNADYYHELVHGAIKHREKENIIRPDLINLLMEARKGQLKHEAEVGVEAGDGFATVAEVSSEDLKGRQKEVWDDNELTAQCFLFLTAGFESSSTLICLAANELMENPAIQRKLIEECDSVKEQLNGEQITYDVLQKMKYLDMVVSETLRKWPPAMMLDRMCVKPYKLEDETGHSIQLNQGDLVFIPVVGIHRDPEHYPDPDRFDPERFSDERKHEIKPFTYLPFGSGPRNCIGSRFALMECKAFLYFLLTNFTLNPAPNSIIPMRLAKARFAVLAENGFNLILKPRE